MRCRLPESALCELGVELADVSSRALVDSRSRCLCSAVVVVVVVVEVVVVGLGVVVVGKIPICPYMRVH